MFQIAIKKAHQYTRPVVVSFRRQDGTTGSSIGAFIVLNQDGWVLTAWHIVDQIRKHSEELKKYNKHQNQTTQINADQTSTGSQKKKVIGSLPKPPTNPITNSSSWWSRDNWHIKTFHINPLADLAIGKIEGFDSASISGYPVIKNPEINFEVGEHLCKLGFPFHSITPKFDTAKKTFKLPKGALPLPLFPIEGMFTRTLIFEKGGASAEFVETSSPGLRGQSGGPTFDAQGRIWAMQSRTMHYPLGFSPEGPNQRNKEHQFLNAGMGTHASSIIGFLRRFNVDFCLSKD